MKQISIWIGISFGMLLLLGFSLGWFIHSNYNNLPTPLSPSNIVDTEPDRPLLAYTIGSLRSKSYGPASVTINPTPILNDPDYSIYEYTASTLGRTMSGVINTPTDFDATTSIIVMLRGWVPPATYSPGVGTKNAAAAFAKAGFITIAPDFFGYGSSDSEPTDSWQGRFEKPEAVIELITSLKLNGLTFPNTTVQPKTIGLWGHSNGGQIALTTLTIMQQSIPTTLWAPVSAPFPYNLLYFSDEENDEGRSTRKWIAMFDELYDSRQFSFTNYLNGLRGPIQLHQGTNDDAVLKWWSDEFVQKIENENKRRVLQKKELAKVADQTIDATESAIPIVEEVDPASLEPIVYDYFLYPNANHNLSPGWNTVVERDIAFFNKTLK